MTNETLRFSRLGDIEFFKRGKVREIYNLKDKFLMVATDRISCFDVVLPTEIPHKGEVLTKLSVFWFELTKDIISNHFISANVDEFPEELQKYKEILKGRSMLVKKASPMPVECVVRGYLAGSGWKEYQETQSICGIKLPKGLRDSDRLPEPIFTPATKEDVGHDVNVTQEYIEKEVGEDIAAKLKEISMALYKKASEYAESKGIIIADTKFEFGTVGDEIILIDEVLTPDSSRFWPKDEYGPGKSQPSFDKQFVRDYLETLDWNKKSPGPELPDEIVKKTTQKYIQALKMITGKEAT
ncbi:MAG: phosphoribosylaminoimidazolesuccinocarboxamide synthase [Candidatus Omnitrophica bacterium]|nr:phosphoribosylaminoimidazolesuccinocarboxamide synthase [Candidatus Omnitrophota bacterium]MBU1133356.1 phosphoribosylaminoimidazolesuccinocarboxamide synthase [Candidatus Omnitrophota bacterium]MBU1366854.1 phosphoribosylaminoimidazolesuccinocarboxamide synthase [Candidatus Omnitrophota bacterium]MBU1524179.1 phosphoribosylaminoimidazolesuccinocarboxamide synthase [Candidatus Omnitrophota bacterium]MBU1810485.1 phosphoribosylaminoimidazolesuccinocarboxamide synthase [Candidatus Omnitrophota